jgi:hypothetical protein
MYNTPKNPVFEHSSAFSFSQCESIASSCGLAEYQIPAF